MSSSSSSQHPHVLVFPYPACGHTFPLLNLTHHLCQRSFSVTIITTPGNLPALSALLDANPNLQTLLLPFPSHPSLPHGVENIKDLGNSANRLVVSALKQLSDPITEWIGSQENPPVALISDFFLGWTLHLTQQMNIPRFAFYTSGAFLAAVLDHCSTHIETVSKFDVVDFPDLPKSPSFKHEQLPSLVREYVEGDDDWNVVREGNEANRHSYGSIFNTFEFIEGDYLNFLKKKWSNERVYAVGPVSLLHLNPRRQDASRIESFSGIHAWLDERNDRSVLYICFGSQKLLKKATMEALAEGLEKCSFPFIWVVNDGIRADVEDDYWVSVEGFSRRVLERGKVIRGWAPQSEILRHRAVGVFLSHCGWNSVLEAITEGVMVVAWPMEADQYVNARLLVDDMGVAVRVCEGEDTVPDTDRLAKVLEEAMCGGVSETIRAKELKEKAADAMKAGGSSMAAMDKLVEELHKLAA